MSNIGQTTYAAAWLPTWQKSMHTELLYLLNWKQEVINTAGNAGITQSQTRDTKYR